MLTTYDNPWNPYEELDEWLIFDGLHGYNCMGITAIIAPSSDKLSDTENDRLLDVALDNFCKHDILGLYVKVTPETAPIIAKNASNGNFMTAFTAKERED